MKENSRSSIRRNSFESEPPVRQNGHATYSPKLGWKSSPLCCAQRESPECCDGRTSHRGSLDLNSRSQKLIKVSECSRKEGPSKLSLSGSGDGGGCGCGFGNSSYDTLPKSFLRNNTNITDAKSYGTLPKNSFGGSGSGVNNFGSLTKVVSGRNLNAGIPGRESPVPPNLPPRNGLVVYRFRADGSQLSPVHRMQQKMNVEYKVGQNSFGIKYLVYIY